MNKKNIVLTGMPSAGKSTVGAPLASKLGLEFIDTDLLIKQRENKELKNIVNEDGLQKFLEIQEEVILGLDLKGCVVSTGGSVIYSEAAMHFLKQDSLVIFLELDFTENEGRITPDRRFARNENQSFADLYKERMPLYRKYADLTVSCTGRGIEEIIKEIEEKLNLK
ncbi:MAG: shikimate kinase [Clostridia bacterium]|nr:shikimate kinase [Clostridia bacterium]